MLITTDPTTSPEKPIMLVTSYAVGAAVFRYGRCTVVGTLIMVVNTARTEFTKGTISLTLSCGTGPAAAADIASPFRALVSGRAVSAAMPGTHAGRIGHSTGAVEDPDAINLQCAGAADAHAGPPITTGTSGTVIVKVQPLPSTLAMSTRPSRRATFLFTTSMPTPRPETSVTVSAVDRPAWKTSAKICG